VGKDGWVPDGGETVMSDSSALTRRERRLAAQRARRTAGFGGWLGYGSGVAGIILVTAFLALGAGPAPTPTPVAGTSHPAQPVASVPEVTTTTEPAETTVTSPAVSPTAPTSTTSSSTTTTTTVPVVAAAATPEAPTP